MYSAQGVHDALKRNASQRIGEDHHVEFAAPDVKDADIPSPEGHLRRQLSAKRGHCCLDLFFIHVESNDTGRLPRITPSQTSVPTADLQHATTIEIHEIVNHARFNSIAIDSKTHTRLQDRHQQQTHRQAAHSIQTTEVSGAHKCRYVPCEGH